MLASVSEAVEQTFLGASKRTMQTVRALRDVSDLVDQVRACGGEEMSRRIGALTISDDHLENDDANAENSLGSITEVTIKIDSMLSELDSLQRTYAMFPVLRVLTQIHGSVLAASRDLDWFAEKINEEADRGRQVVEVLRKTVKRQADQLKGSVKQAGELAKKLQASMQESQLALQKTGEDMQAIDRSDMEAIKSLQQRQRSITSATTDLVTSMQFQDAFRQRVEHVQHALEQLSTLQGRQVLSGFDSDRVLQDSEAQTARVVLMRIVDSQVNSLAEDLSEERHSLDAALRKLGGDTSALRDDLASALRNAQQQLTVKRMRVQLETYCEEVETLDRAEEERATIADSLHEALAAMNADLVSLESVGEAIFQLAVNAVVLAARLGDDGRAIEQVAQQVRSNSADAGNSIRRVRELTEDLYVLCGAVGASDGQTPTPEALAEQVSEELVEQEQTSASTPEEEDGPSALRVAATELIESLDKRGELSGQLVETAREAADGYRVTLRGFEQLGQPLATLMRDRDLWSNATALHDVDAAADPSVIRALADYFNSHYTMESERAIQEVALGVVGGRASTSVPAPSPSAGASSASDDDDLGDILF